MDGVTTEAAYALYKDGKYAECIQLMAEVISRISAGEVYYVTCIVLLGEMWQNPHAH